MEIPHELSTCSEAELLELAVAGEEQAFLLLYGRLKAGIFRYALYLTSSKVNAEEVTQEVFITLLRESHNYRPADMHGAEQMNGNESDCSGRVTG
jgi:DNA-directed RNA polymerase specialized sigma24 family protein